MGSQYHFDNLTMKFIILACLAVSAMAEPEADAQYRPLVRHWNGAVTPVDTYSVQAARAAHLTAKANAYNFRPYTYAAYPYTYGAHYLYKRDAEADPQYFYGNYYGAYNRGYYNYPTYSTYNYGAYPYASSFYGNRFLYKREAEAEADPQYYLGNYYGAYNRGYYSYPSVYRTAYNYGAYPYASNFYGNRFLYKREAEAEAEPQYFGNYYGGYNGYYNNYYNRYAARPYYGYRTYGYPYAY